MSLPQIEPGSDKTILIVHPNIDLCNSIGEALKSIGFGVVIAQDGDMAITLFDIYKDQIVLVLLDIILPKKDGFTVLKEIKAEKDLPVIILTNLDNGEDFQKAKELGAQGYIIRSKTTPEEIAQKVKSIVVSV